MKKSPEAAEAARAYKRAWRAKNKERIAAQRAAHRVANRDRYIAQDRAWRAANKDKASAAHAKWRANNPEKAKEVAREAHLRSMAKDPERVLAQRRAASARKYARDPKKHNVLTARWYRDNADAVRAAYQKRRTENPEATLAQKRVESTRRRASKRAAIGNHSVADIKACLDLQGGRCFYCLASLFHGYEVDHMTPLSRGGSNGPENIVCACVTCNRTKHAKTAAEFILGAAA